MSLTPPDLPGDEASPEAQAADISAEIATAQAAVDRAIGIMAREHADGRTWLQVSTAVGALDALAATYRPF